MEAGGTDSDGREFSSARDMWREEIGGLAGGGEVSVGGSCSQQETEPGSIAKREDWYRKAIAYWQGVDASVDGVLGGYGCVNDTDVKGSDAFLKPLLAERFGGAKRHLVALDCGSGIGRVTKNLLLRFFNEVDLVEPVSHFLEAAREKFASHVDHENTANRADFTPEAGRYDVIWVQWCIGQLPDDDFVSFFKRAKVGLKPNGFFVLKENTARSGFVLDKEDHSITRSDMYFKELFNQCGLYIISSKEQKGLPKELFPVKMYALATERPKTANGRSKMRQNMPAVIR